MSWFNSYWQARQPYNPYAAGEAMSPYAGPPRSAMDPGNMPFMDRLGFYMGSRPSQAGLGMNYVNAGLRAPPVQAGAGPLASLMNIAGSNAGQRPYQDEVAGAAAMPSMVAQMLQRGLMG